MLPAELFGVRAGVLLGQTSKDDAPSFTSGLLIGTDVRIGLTWPAGARIGVMGRPELTRLYAAAIVEAGREPIELDGEHCFLAGIRKIAEMIDMTPIELLRRYLDECPLVGIIRGVTPDEAEAIGEAIFDAGIRIIEVPLNSPDPLESIELLPRNSATARWSGAGRCSSRNRFRGPGRRRAPDRFAQHQRRGHCRNGGGRPGLLPGLFHAVGRLRRDRGRSDRAQIVSGRGRDAGRAQVAARGDSKRRPDSRRRRHQARHDAAVARCRRRRLRARRRTLPARPVGRRNGEKARAYVAGLKR